MVLISGLYRMKEKFRATENMTNTNDFKNGQYSFYYVNQKGNQPDTTTVDFDVVEHKQKEEGISIVYILDFMITIFAGYLSWTCNEHKDFGERVFRTVFAMIFNVFYIFFYIVTKSDCYSDLKSKYNLNTQTVSSCSSSF